MSLEAMAGGQYDAMTDVWSFGVLLWEIHAEEVPDLLAQQGSPASTRGPLLGRILNLLEAGTRLQSKDAWPAQLRELLSSCWLAEPASRPQFAAILSQLDNLQASDPTI